MVRRTIMALLCATLMSVSAFAQQSDDNTAAEKSKSQEIIKTGLNYGPLPAVAFDADKGFQLGALLNIYRYLRTKFFIIEQ